ncbi:MAG: ribose 5-phosphate isomerase B [Treponema sp.]|nr:ribose 5-phosphate isomerase B [Treponema sp.]
MIIAIGCDHAGFEYKEKLKQWLDENGFECVDTGTYSTDAVDYPIYAKSVCEKVLSKEVDFGILFCGTGIGMSIAANKIRGIRAAVCSDIKSAELTRQHNDSNVLCMGAQMIGFITAREITKTFLINEFVGGKHKVRVDMLEN